MTSIVIERAIILIYSTWWKQVALINTLDNDTHAIASCLNEGW